jgi:ATP-dependent Clp endopeptidase proteolytic subunit ClpP
MTTTTQTTTLTDLKGLKERALIATVGKLENECRVVEEALRAFEEDWFWSRQIGLLGAIGPNAAGIAYRTFNKWDWMETELGIAQNTPYVVTFNVGGGRYIDSFALYDIIRLFQAKGHDITCQNTGMMTTHSLIAMQAAKKRVATPRSYFILSDAEGEVGGNTNAHRDAIRFMRQQEEQGWRLIAERTGGKISIDDLKDKTYRGAHWHISAAEALSLGLIDEIDSVIQGQPGFSRHAELLPAEGDSWTARKLKAEARLALLQTELVRAKSAEGAAAMDKLGQIMMFAKVDAETCGAVQEAVNSHVRRGTKNIDLVLNSPGGSVHAGCGLMDVIDTAKERGAGFTTTIFGYAASMGGMLSQTGDHRRISANSYFMVHQVSSMFGSSSSHLEDQQQSMERLQTDLFTYMANRTGGKLTLDAIKAKCNERDWWLTATEALEAGLVDEVI